MEAPVITGESLDASPQLLCGNYFPGPMGSVVFHFIHLPLLVVGWVLQSLVGSTESQSLLSLLWGNGLGAETQQTAAVWWGVGS